MKSSPISTSEEQGRAIARALHEEKAQRQKNMAAAEKRRTTMLENAAQKALSGS
jgi:hypothetical protein